MPDKKPLLTPEERSKVSRSSVRTSKVHERRVARLLTAWSGVPFRRRRVTGREGAVRVMELVADVIACVGEFLCAIECKKGKGFSLDGLMANPTGCLVTSWWHQSCYDAQLVSKDSKSTIYPLMFFKPHPNWDWIAFSAKLTPLLTRSDGTARDRHGVWFPHLLFDEYGRIGPVTDNVSHSSKNKKMVSIDLDDMVMCRWRDFEMNVDPKSVFKNFPSAEELASVAAGDD